MRSYETARGLFSFLAFCAWCLIIFKGLASVAGLAVSSQFSGFGSASVMGSLAAIIPNDLSS